MISVETADSIIFSAPIPVTTGERVLGDCLGAVLRAPLLADRDFPPFDRVTMDGIAIAFASWNSGQRTFRIEGIQAAGQVAQVLNNPIHCLEVMTGAVLPAGADTVVRYEDLLIESGVATLLTDSINPGQNIHRKGSDRALGAELVPVGRILSPAEIATAATVGKTHLRVGIPPRTAVISTGDELVDIDQSPAPHQIRTSNAWAIQAALGQAGLASERFHLPDREELLLSALTDILDTFPFVILSGGVSAGKFDFIPDILKRLGVEMLFHQVAQRPGKPFWFGKRGNQNVVFALPGNPVSTFMCLYRYVLPALRHSLGAGKAAPLYAALSRDVIFKPDLTYFLQVQLQSQPDGRLMAIPFEGRGSGDLANLNDAHAFMELPRGRDLFAAGEAFPVYRYS